LIGFIVNRAFVIEKDILNDFNTQEIEESYENDKGVVETVKRTTQYPKARSV